MAVTFLTNEDKTELEQSLGYITPQMFGAVGDGVTDDTEAFQEALAEASTVKVLAGTYILSDTLTIRSGCKLVLNRDVHLKFTQTNSHAIVCDKYSVLEGGNGTISVPVGFTKGVVVIDSETFTDPADHSGVFPFNTWFPQFKRSATVKDLTIVRLLADGRQHSTDGTCSGDAIYIHSVEGKFLWGVVIDGVNISGAFSNGIRSLNEGGWNHDMKISHVLIDCCEIGVNLIATNNAYLDFVVQPRAAENGTKYAKHGLRLDNSNHCYAPGIKIWDWQLSKKDTDPTCQHIAMFGNCKDFTFSDFLYHLKDYGKDFWKTIYTDTPDNLKSAVCLNEPVTQWFFTDDKDVPYYKTKFGAKGLVSKDDLNNYIDATVVQDFTDVIHTSTAGISPDSGVYNGVGYNTGYMGNSDGVVANEGDPNGYGYVTGYIPVSAGDVVRFENCSLSTTYGGYGRVDLYEEDGTHIRSVPANSIKVTPSYNAVCDENGFVIAFTVINEWVDGGYRTTAFMRLSFYRDEFSINSQVSINEELTYTAKGELSKGITVDYSQIANNKDANLTEYLEYGEHPNYTNLLPTAVGDNGEVFGGVGYEYSGTYIDWSTGKETDGFDGSYATGFIPCTKSDILRIKNVPWIAGGNGTGSGRGILCAYDADKNFLGSIDDRWLTATYDAVTKVTAIIPHPDWKNLAFIRIRCAYWLSTDFTEIPFPEDLTQGIVTVNEEITSIESSIKIEELEAGVEAVKSNFSEIAIPDCINQLPIATATIGGEVINGVGYEDGRLVSGTIEATEECVTTGFIPVKEDDIIRFDGCSFNPSDYRCVLNEFSADGTFKRSISAQSMNSDPNGYELVKDDNGNIIQFKALWNTGTYMRFTFLKANFTDSAVISVNEEITYTEYERGLADGVMVKYDQILQSPVEALIKRVEELEARIAALENPPTPSTATVSGVWQLNEELDISLEEPIQNVNFNSNSYSFNRIYTYYEEMDQSLTLNYSGEETTERPYYYGGGWSGMYDCGEFDLIDFGTEPQEVSQEFYDWLTANATQQ